MGSWIFSSLGVILRYCHYLLLKLSQSWPLGLPSVYTAIRLSSDLFFKFQLENMKAKANLTTSIMTKKNTKMKYIYQNLPNVVCYHNSCSPKTLCSLLYIYTHYHKTFSSLSLLNPFTFYHQPPNPQTLLVFWKHKAKLFTNNNRNSF